MSPGAVRRYATVCGASSTGSLRRQQIEYYDVVQGDLGASREPFGGAPLGALGSDKTAAIREVLGSNPEAKLVVHESTVATWRTILAAPSTLRPDALARTPREVEIVTVPDAGSFTIGEGTTALTLYPVETEHAADLILAHHAASNTVFVVDIYSPGFAGQLNADDFKASLATHAIPTANLQIVGGHGPETHDYDDVLTFAP